MTHEKEDTMRPPDERKGAMCAHAPAEWTDCPRCIEDFYLEKLTAEQRVRAELERPLADLGGLLREAGALLDRPTRAVPGHAEEPGRREVRSCDAVSSCPAPEAVYRYLTAPRVPTRLRDLVETWPSTEGWLGRGKVFSVLKNAPPAAGASPDEVTENVLIAALNELEAQKATLEARATLAEEELERTRAALLVAEYTAEHLDASWRWACQTAQEERVARRELLASVIGRKEAEHDLPDLPAPKERPSPATRSAGTANMLKVFRDAVAEAEKSEARAEELRVLAERLATQKDGAYAERNELAVLVATMARALGLTAGQRPDDSAEEGWQTLVVVDLPSGQVSWHLPDSDQTLAEALPPATKFWDGHSKAEARQRIREAIFSGFRASAADPGHPAAPEAPAQDLRSLRADLGATASRYVGGVPCWCDVNASGVLPHDKLCARLTVIFGKLISAEGERP